MADTSISGLAIRSQVTMKLSAERRVGNRANSPRSITLQTSQG